ncbi:hypothetical protein RRSWK_06679 [Rhodopirellula sp. SWK7]|nr:hypothetical protein RRSWK_06679 [Rhodopirellula sp. SWK7]
MPEPMWSTWIVVELGVVIGTQFPAGTGARREAATDDRPVTAQVQAVGGKACSADARELGVDD